MLGGGNAVAIRFTVRELSPLWGPALRFGGTAALLWVIAMRAARRCRFETLALSAWLTGEQLNSGLLLGGALVLLGVWVGAFSGGPPRPKVPQAVIASREAD